MDWQTEAISGKDLPFDSAQGASWEGWAMPTLQ